MKTKNIFFYSYLLSFVVISTLCIANEQPLVFYPIRYDLVEFLKLVILLGILNLGLVFGLIELEKIKTKKLLEAMSTGTYFVLTSTIALFIFTLFAGFVESGTPFFYYHCVGNSCLYLIGGYVTAIFAALLFTKRFTEINKTTLDQKS